MLCRRHLIYSFFAFCVSMFISCFFLSSPSYATSQVITCNTLSCYNQQIKLEHTSSTVGFSFSYVSIEIQSDYLNHSTTVGSILINGSQSTRYCYQNGSGYLYCLFNTDSNYKNNVPWSSWMINDTLPWSYTVTFYDSFPIAPCECPDCPEIPENPYDDKLDALIKAVYFVPAVLLAIYFFYIMYSWYIRS